MTNRYDAIIIGGGHNGLTCAFYLARSGMRVRVLEARHIVGGAAVTEEFHPGFRNSTASYTVSLLRPKVIADMKLHDRGYRVIERTISNFFPFPDTYLKLGGGMARTQAAAARIEQGVEISLETPVAKVLVNASSTGGKAQGVKLASGEELYAPIVAANVGPALLFRQMVDASDLDDDFRRRIKGFKTGSGTFRMNVALSELPDFTVLPGKAQAEHHTAGIVIAPGMAYMDQAFDDAKAHGWSREPIVEIMIPSTVDDSLAPPGGHVASLFCQQFAPELPDGQSWDDVCDNVADLIINTVDAHAPNFKRSVIARQIHSPLDLERKFGLIGGDIFHGAMGLDQLWSARPVLGNGDYRSPIKGLYMCGSGTHPGGGVTGAPGHNAAAEIIRDRSILWKALHRGRGSGRGEGR